MTEPTLVVRSLTKRYGRELVLRAVDLTIDAGVVLGLVGPNGSGKTTLISIVAGLLRPDNGSIRIHGTDPAANPRLARSHVGLAPQELAVYPTDTTQENLILFGELSDYRGRELRRRVEEIADSLGLSGVLDRKVGQLSGGQQRRLNVALAVLHRPSLVLLDEPTAGVDVETRIALVEMIGRLAAEGAAVLYSTNALAEVEALGDSVAILDDGRIAASGIVRDVVGASGAAVLELTFDGPAPQTTLGPDVDAHVEVDGSVLRIRTDEPDLQTPLVLSRLGSHLSRLRSLEVVRPSLETAFLSITGRRYGAEREERPDPCVRSS